MKFETEGGEVSLSQIHYIGANVVVAVHPTEGIECVFLKNGNVSLSEMSRAAKVVHREFRVDPKRRELNGVYYHMIKQEI